MNRKIIQACVALCCAMLNAPVFGQTVLVDEDWQTDPLLANGLQIKNEVTNPFPGWTYSDTAVRVRNSNNNGDIPDDSTVTDSHGHNQTIELNGDASVIEYDLGHNWGNTDIYLVKVEMAPSSWGGNIQRYVRPSIRQVSDNTVLWDPGQNMSGPEKTALPLLPIDGNNNYYGPFPDYPSELTFIFTVDASTFSTGTPGEGIKLRIDSSGQRSVYINRVKLTLNPAADSTPPNPDPLTWEDVPVVVNFTSSAMRVNSAIDDQYGVEYYFENTVRGTNSGWQESRDWAETGLDYNTLYTYRVKARDKSSGLNESTAWSSTQDITTPTQDLTPPSPDPLTWDTVPTVADYRSITMSVNAATDTSGVEYNFYNITNATESGWQNSRFWTQKDLDPNTQYTYEVRARDKSPDQNVSSAPSSRQSVTTPSEPADTLFITRFQDPLFSDNQGNPDLGGWALVGNTANIKTQKATGDGVRTDTDLSVPGDNFVIHFEYTGRTISYDIDHNWSATDKFLLTFNASPQSWNGETVRYIRPSLEQQDGTVLWAPGENASGPEKTLLPLYSTLTGPSFQADASTLFSYTINASDFIGGTPGQPIRIKMNSSGFRGLFFDNIHLSLIPDPYTTWANSYGLAGNDALKTAKTDGDTLSQLQEWAFGTNPNVNDASALTVTDGSTFTPGIPRVDTEFNGGNPMKLRYVRRKDHATVGLVYTPEFTNSLDVFTADPADPTPSVVSDAGGDYEVVEVPFPLFDASGKKSASMFGRVSISEN